MSSSVERPRRRHTQCGAVFFCVLTLGACGDSDARLVGQVPTNPDALYSWLVAGKYVEWDAEPEPHPTTGPHGDEVQTYFNFTLAASLEGSNMTHPVESASVKELFVEDQLVGWAVSVKSRPEPVADSWYFYEVLDRTAPDAAIEGQGESLCAGCHAADTDFVLTMWPL